ncbi:protein-disulfide isomerase [Planktotalea frisia]|jgi:protein-disulfide isomerase|uniref:Disulfide bond formation protein D n=1 Tax=Planktotalea frisia TaxID=696762 RepID=A0A1L9P146_9RHOB|nr:DsbA family protein [Planktotalea frisia]OJI95134.1 disulfide bond formation protein D precursor [Planktotalea frisia]PZX31609.1 protein-disulfide isomerase [Planktotalea frisia]
MLRTLLSAAAAVMMTLTMASAQESEIPDMIQGDADAKVEIIEYASYTCPHCASFHAGPYKDLKKDYIETGKVKFIYREVYFDRFGLWASMIARCAGPDRFFGMTDLLYKEQSLWSRAGDPAAIVVELRKIGLKGGLDNDALDACLEDADNAQALVAWYQENAERDNIRSTPSFLINGEPYSNMNYADFSAIIDEKLAE